MLLFCRIFGIGNSLLTLSCLNLSVHGIVTTDITESFVKIGEFGISSAFTGRNLPMVTLTGASPPGPSVFTCPSRRQTGRDSACRLVSSPVGEPTENVVHGCKTLWFRRTTSLICVATVLSGCHKPYIMTQMDYEYYNSPTPVTTAPVPEDPNELTPGGAPRSVVDPTRKKTGNSRSRNANESPSKTTNESLIWAMSPESRALGSRPRSPGSIPTTSWEISGRIPTLPLPIVSRSSVRERTTLPRRRQVPLLAVLEPIPLMVERLRTYPTSRRSLVRI